MVHKTLLILALFFLTILNVRAQSNEVTVSNVKEFSEAIQNVKSGHTIVLKNGTWNNAKLIVSGIGTKEAPIKIKAEKAGEVILTGNSEIKISGEYITIEGLWFKDGGTNSKSVVSFRKNSTEYASNSRLTNCTFSYYNPTDPSLSTHWVDIWGQNNRVDHNNFTGKTNHGTTVVVWLKGDEHIENNHRIDHNFFGLRPELGINGGETIRIGTSTYSMKSSKTIVENNTFKHCNGEIEIISNKSGDNIFRNNLFLESEGTLTLRHGNNAMVENNVFIGNNKPRTGGIRVINEGHIVRNNLLIGLTGDETRAPISVMNGVPNSPLNRYHQVKNAKIINNTIIGCGPIEFGVGKDEEKTLAPESTILANNLILNETHKRPIIFHDNSSSNSFKNNFIDASMAESVNGFTTATIELQVVRGLPMPTSNNTQLVVERTVNAPARDMVNLKRDPFVAGAFNLGNRRIPIALAIKTGPAWNPEIVPPKVEIKPQIISVKPGLNTLNKALKNAVTGTTLKLEAGTYFIESTNKISGKIIIEGSPTEETLIIAAKDLDKPLNYFFRVQEKSELYLKNLTIDGEHSNPVKYAVVSPDKNISGMYNLFIDNCILKNFINKDGGSIYKAYEGTLADTISIKNSRLENSYRGLNLSYQKDNFGRYNAENIILNNCVFTNIEEFAINYRRNGINPNFRGGNLEVTNCVFNRVANTEKGNIIKLKGIKTVAIKNSVFQNSFNSTTALALTGVENKISNSLFSNCGAIKISQGAIKENIVYKNPKWEDKKNFIPSEKSYLLKKNNNIDRIGIKPIKN